MLKESKSKTIYYIAKKKNDDYVPEQNDKLRKPCKINRS